MEVLGCGEGVVDGVAVEPNFEEFQALALEAKVVPVYAELAADFETPLSAYLKIRDGGFSFLFESAESTDASGRWSILGSGIEQRYEVREGQAQRVSADGSRTKLRGEGDFLTKLEAEMAGYSSAGNDRLPPFFGGLVGYVGYDAVRHFEPSVGLPEKDELDLPEAIFLLAETVLVFDHRLRKLFVIVNALAEEGVDLACLYETSAKKVGEILQKLDRPLHVSALNGFAEFEEGEVQCNTTREEYESMVLRAKDYIAAGDAFQIVPSQRFQTPFAGTAVNLYRALRYVNPSPYLFTLELGEFSLVGSSPEVHVKVVDGRIDIRPLAGTRWRGETSEEDDALAKDLLADEKERAEHLMLVDLARNDVGRVAKHGSVQVDDFMTVERYSHVMHIVSNVSGQIQEGQSSYDVLRATFPAGTVSGAPKIRAMQVIGELEKSRRGAYSGAVGYFSWDGAHDSCITLRTIVLKDGNAYVQAGAGVVADSDPDYEYRESFNKAKAQLRAIGLAKTLESAPAPESP